MKIVIIDYQLGNISSIQNMLKRIGVIAVCSNKAEEIAGADKLILPGVGSFDHGMQNLHAAGILSVLNQAVLEQHKPVLGICLGMQLLLDASEEGKEKGLAWIPGHCKRFKFAEQEKELKIPHMGWNVVNHGHPHPYLANMPQGETRFYFVHSYHAVCDQKYILATTKHGYDFPAMIHHQHIVGAQFHPEKSHRFGMALLKNFVEANLSC